MVARSLSSKSAPTICGCSQQVSSDYQIVVVVVVHCCCLKFLDYNLNGENKDKTQSDNDNFPVVAAAASRSTVSVAKPAAANRSISVMRSKIATKPATVVASADKEMSDGQFSFQMLKIRGKEIREQMNIQYILFLMLFFLGLYIVIMLKRSSSQNGSMFGYVGSVASVVWNSSRRRSAGRSTEPARGEKYALSNLFRDRDKKLKRSGFNRLPQDEAAALENDDDDDEDDEDVLEDFSASRKGNARLV